MTFSLPCLLQYFWFYWWLIRVTLVVDWWVLPQNFGPVVRTYEGLLWLCEWTLGGNSSSRWWGHISTICDHRSFFRHRWWVPYKPSIEMLLLPSLPLHSLRSPSLPFAPLHSLCSPLLPSSLPFNPLCSLNSLDPSPGPLPHRWWGPYNLV